MEALILRRLREGQGGWLCPRDPKKAGVWPVAAPLHQIFLAGMSASHRHLEPEPLQALWPGLEAAGHGPVPEPFICGTALGALFFTFFWGGRNVKIPISLSPSKARHSAWPVPNQ